MSAEWLREAAKVLREGVEAATSAVFTPWRVELGWTENSGTSYALWSVEPPGLVAEGMAEEVATYIATMHPGVGLALAEWLERVAVGGGYGYDSSDDNYRHALAVADAILGGQS